MTKHFEDIWEEAEKVSEEFYSKTFDNKDDLAIFEEIKVALDTLSETKSSEDFGTVLLALCFISKKYNINAWTTLLQQITNAKIDLLEDED